ncbi:MAG: hypothetical protein WBA74_14715 [Cyclobacteriaceae bacterium]
MNLEWDIAGRNRNSQSGYSIIIYGLAPFAGLIYEVDKSWKIFAESRYQMIINNQEDLDFTFIEADNNTGFFDYLLAVDVGVRYRIL